MKNFILVLLLIISVPFCWNNIYPGHSEKNTGTKTDGYIATEISKASKLLDGLKPEAKWIWDNGIPNPQDY